jgi:hypothetical protein
MLIWRILRTQPYPLCSAYLYPGVLGVRAPSSLAQLVMFYLPSLAYLCALTLAAASISAAKESDATSRDQVTSSNGCLSKSSASHGTETDEILSEVK